VKTKNQKEIWLVFYFLYASILKQLDDSEYVFIKCVSSLQPINTNYIKKAFKNKFLSYFKISFCQLPFSHHFTGDLKRILSFSENCQGKGLSGKLILDRRIIFNESYTDMLCDCGWD